MAGFMMSMTILTCRWHYMILEVGIDITKLSKHKERGDESIQSWSD